MAKCEEAIAWDEWMKNNPQSLDPTTLKAPPYQRQYLENRLARAFQDGVKVGKSIAKQQKITR